MILHCSVVYTAESLFELYALFLEAQVLELSFLVQVQFGNRV